MAQPHQHGSDQGRAQYGSGLQPSRQLQSHPSSMTEHGRNTPPPSKSRDDSSNLDYATLVQKHDELQAKYTRVKKYYYEKDAQVTSLQSTVTALQNTVANQRLSMSRTTLDDQEYSSRFNRLDGAISQLSFNIRKHWKGIPPWVAPMVNKDAHEVGTKEMTAVGRACITRWVVDEIFDLYFHPRLEPGLSIQLKNIEKNIRRAGQVQVATEAQRDDLTVKLISWRLITLDGLAESMADEQGTLYKQDLTARLVEELTASLQRNLLEPPPPGLENGVSVIIDLVIGLAAALPLESRDVCVSHYVPGTPISEIYMRVETGIPSLTNPGSHGDYPASAEPQQGDQASNHSGDSTSDNEGDPDSNGGVLPRADSLAAQSGNGGNGHQHQAKKEEGRKKGLFGNLVGSGKKPTMPESNNSNLGLAPTTVGRQGSFASIRDRESMDKADRDRRIRFAAFVGVEVRGKGREGEIVLIKAPCYAL